MFAHRAYHETQNCNTDPFTTTRAIPVVALTAINAGTTNNSKGHYRCSNIVPILADSQNLQDLSVHGDPSHPSVALTAINAGATNNSAGHNRFSHKLPIFMDF
ncbi:hypothetical protein J6590_077787 [Homalodisca vitripennis]|nr:hypothetical protein J6590_077787 [Homalodisca vitripennis]